MGEKDIVDVVIFFYNKNEGLKIINSISVKYSIQVWFDNRLIFVVDRIDDWLKGVI